jgi:hypothetical protein
MAANNQKPGLVGYIGLLVIVVFLAFFGLGIRSLIAPYFNAEAPAVISLSTYFLDKAGNPVNPNAGHHVTLDSNSINAQLNIKGAVYKAGKPLQAGSVLITVNKQDDTFSQSITVDLKDGKFETQDSAFSSLRPDDQLSITAEVTSSQLSQSAVYQLYLNSGSPKEKLIVEWSMVGVTGIMMWVFFYAFTGRKKPKRNRIAIIFSYCIIGIALAIALLAPVLLLRFFPNAREAMVGMPAGLVITHISNQEKCESQWALNIGGHSFHPAQACVDTTKNPKEAENRDNTSPSGATTIKSPSTGNPSPPPAVSSGATPASSPDAPSAGAGAKSTVGATNVVGQAATDVAKNSTSSIDTGDDVIVQGGLVVPLYVIVLSVIGGAINMTRKVPRYQREGEYDESALRPKGMLESKVASFWRRIFPGLSSLPIAQDSVIDQPESKVESNPVPVNSPVSSSPKDVTAQNQAAPQSSTKPDATADSTLSTPEAIEVQINERVKAQVERNCETDANLVALFGLVEKMRAAFDNKTSDRLLNFESFDDWYGTHGKLRELLGSNWRVELLNQYMYLISAPFLAIVTYYMLDLLGLTKPPVVVVLSFSVGLISEKIVSWILGVATGYLRTATSNQPVKKNAAA